MYLLTNPRIVREIKTVTEYKEGKTDTLIKLEYVHVTDTVYSFPSDTTEIDSNGSRSFTTTFKIDIDTLTGVEGEVTFKELTKSFLMKIKNFWHPESLLTRVDTLTNTITIEKPQPFYDTFEFGFGIGVLITALATLLLGA